MRDEKCEQNFGWKACKKENTDGLGLDERMILKWILRKLGMVCTSVSFISGQGTVASPFGQGNEPSSSIKGE
jgi:hypothetical protein